ncbi:MAG: hypothetical protein AB7U73_01230 [Pirellulales bacterium]
MTPLPTSGAGPSASGGGPPPFVPSDLSGLTLYLDANDLATLWQTNDTSTPVTTTGQDVGRWLDKAAGVKVLTQATANERPTWQTGQSGANGRGVIVTPSAAGAGSDWLGGSVAISTLYGTSQLTSFAVCRSATPNASRFIVADSVGGYFLGWNAGGTQLVARAWNGTQGQSEAAINASLDTTYIVCWRRDSQPHLFISLNGGAETDVASAGNLTLQTANIAIPTVQAGFKHQGWVGHFLSWSRDLSASERNQVGNWLAALYGLTWTNQS